MSASRAPRFCRAPSYDAERQERACAAERVRSRLCLIDRALERGKREVDVAAGRGDESAAARDMGEAAVASESSCLRLPGVEEADGVVHLADLDQDLGEVAAPPESARFTQPTRHGGRFCCGEGSDRSSCVTSRALHEPQDRLDLGHEGWKTDSELAGLRRQLAGLIRLATMVRELGEDD